MGRWRNVLYKRILELQSDDDGTLLPNKKIERI